MLSSISRYVRTALTIAVVLGFVVFAVDNRQLVHLSLFPLPYEADLPLFLSAILFFFVGLLFGFYQAVGRHAALRSQIKAEQKRVSALENQIDSLRSEKSMAGLAQEHSRVA